MPRTFGHLPDFPPGSLFENRAALSESRVHPPTQAGICGGANEGAESIVVSGGYVDDQDLGSVIVYTGAGGRKTGSARQEFDQHLTRTNRSLVTSQRLGIPVRVIRGSHPDVYDPPSAGYRYDGLYSVEDHWPDVGIDGFRIWRFRLRAVPDESLFNRIPWASDSHFVAEPSERYQGGPTPAPRTLVTTSRIVRDSAVTREVKRLHDFRCQACGERLDTPTGPYAEAAHIRPLGAPHHGPDVLDNVLCLCPNHHATFDLYAWTVGELGELIGLDGTLRTALGHTPSPEHLRAHRAQFDATRAG